MFEEGGEEKLCELLKKVGVVVLPRMPVFLSPTEYSVVQVESYDDIKNQPWYRQHSTQSHRLTRFAVVVPTFLNRAIYKKKFSTGVSSPQYDIEMRTLDLPRAKVSNLTPTSFWAIPGVCGCPTNPLASWIFRESPVETLTLHPYYDVEATIRAFIQDARDMGTTAVFLSAVVSGSVMMVGVTRVEKLLSETWALALSLRECGFVVDPKCTEGGFPTDRDFQETKRFIYIQPCAEARSTFVRSVRRHVPTTDRLWIQARHGSSRSKCQCAGLIEVWFSVTTVAPPPPYEVRLLDNECGKCNWSLEPKGGCETVACNHCNATNFVFFPSNQPVVE